MTPPELPPAPREVDHARTLAGAMVVRKLEKELTESMQMVLFLRVSDALVHAKQKITAELKPIMQRMELDNSVPDEVVDERAVEILQQVLTLVIHYATEVHSIKSGKYKGESVCRVGAPADLKRKNELYLSTGPRDVKLSCDDASRINFQVEYINDEEFRNGRPEVGAQVSFVPDNYPPSQCVWVEV